MRNADYTKKDPTDYSVKRGDTLNLSSYKMEFENWDVPPTIDGLKMHIVDGVGNVVYDASNDLSIENNTVTIAPIDTASFPADCMLFFDIKFCLDNQQSYTWIWGAIRVAEGATHAEC